MSLNLNWSDETARNTWLSARPTRNPVIESLRDSWDGGDNWGSALTALFAVCDVMSDLSIEIPSEWEFSQSIMGSDDEDYNYVTVMEALQDLNVFERSRVLTHAGWILHRLTHVLDLAGQSY